MVFPGAIIALMDADTTYIQDFALIMAVAGIALILFRRLGQPAVLGYLVAGIIISPHTLPNPPVENDVTIQHLADLGLVLLLFGVGLEFGWERIRQIGPRVLLIGVIEITVMLAIGFQLGTLLGWTDSEAIFLGAALSASSSAILIKVLQDSGQLTRENGKLMVGILVVEDFAAVLLLSVLSGAPGSGSPSAHGVRALLTELALFAAAALVLGRLAAPRVVRYVARFHSKEALLIAGLALCFGMAFVAEELDLSAAAGAFLIGTVLGDIDHAEDLRHMMAPIRDMFAALFFVSIGMLVDLSQTGRFLGPALLITAVFIIGKIALNTAATFLAGHDGRLSLRVGMGMPQVGEFSLAIAKVGVDRGAVAPVLYPIMAVATAATAMLHPFIFRSSDRVADFFSRRSPILLKHYVTNLALWMATLRSVGIVRTRRSARMQRSGRTILMNMVIMMMLIAVGTFAVGWSERAAERLGLPANIIGLIIAGTVLAACLPCIVFMWRAARSLADDLSQYTLMRGIAGPQPPRRDVMRVVLRNTLIVFSTILLFVWATPLLSRLVALGGPSIPLAIGLGILALGLTMRFGFQMHRALETSFTKTFLGEPEKEEEPGKGARPEGQPLPAKPEEHP